MYREGPKRRRIARTLPGSLIALAMLSAGSPERAGADTPPPSRLRLFLQCPDFTCDFEFLKRELAWVDWVRDRQDARVHVLLTTRPTGSGGTEIVFYVTRPHGGGPVADTVRAYARPQISDDEARHLELRILQAILARDLAERPEGEHLSVSWAGAPAGATAASPPERDPWNAWVMRLSGNGFFNGQQSFRNFSLYGNASASRVVETSKVSLSTFGNYSEQRFSSPRFVGVQRGWGGNAGGVRSIGPRWSAGSRLFFSSSKFSNQHFLFGAGPAVEFDLYPYSQSSRRQLTFAYEITGRFVRYDEITLYGKTREALWTQGLTAKLAFTQPWGTVGIGPDFSQYLHDLSKYRVTLQSQVQLNLVRGFSLNLSGFAAHIRDQLSLPRGGATDDEVLLQQRQLATSFQYFASVGLSYSFGSRTNNVVNPRLSEVYGSF